MKCYRTYKPGRVEIVDEEEDGTSLIAFIFFAGLFIGLFAGAAIGLALGTAIQ